MAIRKGWSLERDTISSKELDSLLAQFEWDMFPATYSNYELVPKLPGIYIFRAIKNISSSKSVLSTPVYIGIAEKSVATRYYIHRSTPWFADGWKCFGNNFTYSAWFPDKNFIDQFPDKYDLKRELERLETVLIESFGPIVNDKVSFTSKGVKSKLKDFK